MGSRRWRRIDKTESGLLQPLYDDACFFYLERTSEGYLNPSNQRIINFKHNPEEFRDVEDVWRYKQKEITAFAQDIADWLHEPDVSRSIDAWGNVALVPMPTSKPSTHEFFDSRLVDLCDQVALLDERVRVENILDVAAQVKPSHAGGTRNVGLLKKNLVVHKPTSELQLVILVDDLLTSGSHYVACVERLGEFFPDIVTIGLFLARHRYV